jgi:hypothetical protein
MQNFIVGAVPAMRASGAAVPVAKADAVMMVAFFSAILVLLFMLELRRSRHSLLPMGLAGSCLAVCTFISGAWPAGLVLIAWSATNIWKWIQFRRQSPEIKSQPHHVSSSWAEPTRVQRLFDDPPLTFN